MDPIIVILSCMWTLLAIGMLWLLVRSNLKYLYKLFIVPLTFGLLFYTIVSTIGLLGYPVLSSPEGEFLIVNHRVAKEKGKEYIILWIYRNGKDRMYKFEATKETKEKLKQAQKRAQKTGIPQMAKVETGKANPFEGSLWKDIKIYDFPHQEMLRKIQPKK